MFLDEKLKIIYEEFAPSVLSGAEVLPKLAKNLELTIFSEFYIPTTAFPVSDKEYLEYPVKLKQIDNMWKLFCKQHDTYHWFNAGDFQKMLGKHYINPYSRQRIFRKLGWEVPSFMVAQVLFDVDYRGKKYVNLDFGYHAEDKIEDSYIWNEDGPWSMQAIGDQMIDFQLYSWDQKKLKMDCCLMQPDAYGVFHRGELISEPQISISNIRVAYE